MDTKFINTDHLDADVEVSDEILKEYHVLEGDHPSAIFDLDKIIIQAHLYRKEKGLKHDTPIYLAFDMYGLNPRFFSVKE